jgi:hypothetical protein
MDSPRRSLTFADLLILIAGLAVAFSLIRAYAYVDHVLFPTLSFGSRQAIVASSSLALVGLSLGTLALRLVPPRPPLRRLVRQPGFLATLAVASNAVSQTVSRLCGLLTGPAMSTRQWYTWAHNWLFSLWVPFFVGPAIFLACVIGVLGGFALRRADWVEHLGRVLAFVWLLYWVLNMTGMIRE